MKAKGVLLVVTYTDAMVLLHSAGETEHGGEGDVVESLGKARKENGFNLNTNNLKLVT